MTFKFTVRNSTVAITAVAAALALGGIAQAITNPNFIYSTPKVGYYTIDHMAMQPDSDGAANDYLVGWGGGVQTSSNKCFNAGVNLPNGAKINDLIVNFVSTASGAPMIVLYRHRMSDGLQQEIGEAAFTDTSGVYVSKSVLILSGPSVVNNAKFSYGFGVCLSANSRFYSARIEYSYRNAGD